MYNTDLFAIGLRSFDGSVGSLFKDLGLFVTTPNMDVVHTPLTLCKTRMRRQNHFGQDDPCCWPQPFHLTVGHLAVIPNPHVSENRPFYWAWYQPVSADFQSVHFPGLDGMVCLSTSLQEHILEMCTAVSNSILKLPEDLRNDKFVIRTRDQVHKYLERLGECNSQKTVLLELACLQRVVLELYARGQWLDKWVHRFERIDSSYEVDPTVMGAFTGDLDVAASLYRVGLPVWLVRPYAKHVMNRIDRFVVPLGESSHQTLPIRDSEDFFFNVADSDPPHPTIYTGLPGHFKRYKRMVIYVKQQFCSALVGSFQNEVDCTPSSFSLVQHASSSVHTPQSRPLSKSATSLQSTSVLAWLDVTTREWASPPQPKKKAKISMLSFTQYDVYYSNELSFRSIV